MFENYRSKKAEDILLKGGTWEDVADFYGYSIRELQKAVTWRGEDKKTIRRMDRLSLENGGKSLYSKKHKAKSKAKPSTSEVIVTVRKKLLVVLKDAKWHPNDNMIVFGGVKKVNALIYPADVIYAVAEAVSEAEYVKESWTVSDSFTLTGQINRIFSYMDENPNAEIRVITGPISKHFF